MKKNKRKIMVCSEKQFEEYNNFLKPHQRYVDINIHQEHLIHYSFPMMKMVESLVSDEHEFIEITDIFCKDIGSSERFEERYNYNVRLGMDEANAKELMEFQRAAFIKLRKVVDNGKNKKRERARRSD